MRVGVPREIKNHEYRVALTPGGAHQLTGQGHEVVVETGAGLGSQITDADFVAAGARIVATADEAWAAELVLKVKEPVAAEYHHLREDLLLFTYLHLAADRPLTRALLDAGTTAIAYETVQLPDRSLPLLAPMSEIAGRLAPQVGAYHLMRNEGGRGVLLGGVPGVENGKVVILGGGVAGAHAAEIALGMRADVTVIDLSLPTLRRLDARFGGHVKTVASNTLTIAEAVAGADLVVGSVLIPGAKAPKLVTNEMVAGMRAGSVLVDIAVDQGGCFADSRPTTHDDPTFLVHQSVFYCVANMPGAVPRTSTYALTNATLPYAGALATRGWQGALRSDPALAAGLTSHHGALTNLAVATAHELTSTDPGLVLAG
ncbi:alanine dehydrogenase [Nakamurella flavida]|uniref:Alanine dehydrogenase n=1 Tax=Nakamurella flavida TaxID=363630 RepID=A0A939C4N7_9ACTN|nr:alanine dehydrogenase [Nakamurella flavida]MBM9478291.1 alanine dehydrogenase [Nakamurella flavida]MDP9777538.1 alanine dehydrogenase [Nakamurella flavida]